MSKLKYLSTFKAAVFSHMYNQIMDYSILLLQGAYFAWKATAMGKNYVNGKTFLEKRY